MDKKSLVMPTNQLIEQADSEIQELAFGMGVARSLISRDYLSQMANGEIIQLIDDEKNKPPQEKFRLFRVNSIVYDKFESINEKLHSLFCALSFVKNCNLVMILNNEISKDSETQSFYIGVSGKSPEETQEAGEILEKSLAGNFPGCELEKCVKEKIEGLMPDLVFKSKDVPRPAVSSISIDAIRRSSDENFIQGMEKFADGMRGKPYTLMVVAAPVTSDELQTKINSYRDLYTQISPYKTTTQTLNETHGSGNTVNFGTQISNTLTQAKTVTNSWGTTDATSHGKNISQKKANLKGTLTEIGAMLLGMTGGVMLGAPALSLLGFAYGGKLAGSYINDIMDNSPENETETDQNTHSTTEQESVAQQISKAIVEGINKSLAINENSSRSAGLQRTVENKPVIDMLNSLDRQIKIMNSSFGQGAYNVAAYVISDNKITSEVGAGLYSSLLSGGESDSISAINTWDEKISVESIQDYLLRGLNPAIKLCESGALNSIDLTTFVPCNEMPLHFFFPRKSLPGLPISHCAEFARSMPCAVDKNVTQINLGKVFHFGREEKNQIFIPKEFLCSHTCLVGAPGSGKSNMAYHLLSQLIEKDLNFMVIEPAKGEYSQVLGGYPSVDFLSTEINTENFFSINPFSFPNGVNAIDHVESLMSLLTTCWTMYAAMTEILKDAVLQIYEDAGWDMSNSGLPYEENDYRFPTFHDLLKVLPELIENSNYSNEVKGNYKGALLERLKSMTNGANKMIFGNDCRSDEELFNRKLIIDTSSLNTSETRALLMGVLVIRLNEFRKKTENREMNCPLHHVTLLEEAHNLLSAGVANTTNNVNAKAVEIISNAIKEMRSFGEGLIIIDQTPSKLDSSVISNTATKIVFNLQSVEDSLPMGKAMSLNGDQTEELSVLPCGVCVVRSRGWTAPVQIKVPLFDKSKYKPYEPQPIKLNSVNMRVIRGKVFTALLNNEKSQAESLAKELKNEPRDLVLLKALKILKNNNEISLQERLNLYKEFFDTVRWFKIPTKEGLLEWDKNTRKQLKRRASIDIAEQDTIIQELLTSIALKPITKNLLDAWIAFKTERDK